MRGFNFETTRNGDLRSRKSRLIISYIPDYFFLVVMAVLWGVLSLIEPFHRDFSLTDKSIQYPHKPDSIPFYAAVLLCFVLPLVVIILWAGLIRRSFHDMNSGVLGLCLSIVLNMMITNTVKNLAGRLRPDFIDRCNLDKDTALSLQPAIGMVTSAICKQTDKSVFWDGMRSFPSGHTSFSFAGFTYLSLWLAGHLRIGDRRGRTYKSFITLVPELAALLIGISRTKDYRHHWQDVLAGAILGVFMGWFGYHQYYPSPNSLAEDPSYPFPPRIPVDGSSSPSYNLKTFNSAAENNGATNAAAAAGQYGDGALNAAGGSAPANVYTSQPQNNPLGAGSSGYDVPLQQPAYNRAQAEPSMPSQTRTLYSSDSLAGSFRV
ncbi:hypothetical protein GGI25_004861 [Coemansia spiralis]|uniref:Phosphatidic acid phosphatase type 2/haloperoxidase domain-containing protein n=2 Tax=Coemansia TaxID=4863 RepID=A0A9W8G3N9_9FUNG|nr:phosphatidic acid phosphatase type 2/haloperoxidase [Coemansia spiralis]KAJ1991930.1 hypothetical protein EDC05_003084 [Coemansia umbellata]KAJ2625301.1 hypothetical protein GGI26_000771 [Coemansia sp. RSA 1358]KAJ2673046.1 hypothetical protein GGI25_004861 [Coemansia spiralis]